MPDTAQTPPKGDTEKAEKYINQLVELINQNKIDTYRTDLKKFDPTTLQDHYSINLRDYQIEISHSKHPESAKNSYVMIFNNLKNLSAESGEKVILGYIYLPDSLYMKFKIAADGQIEAKRRAEEEKRFNQAVEPIDQILSSAAKNSDEEKSPLDDSPNSDFSKSSESHIDSSQIHQI